MALGAPPHFGAHPLQVMMRITRHPAPTLEGEQFSKSFRDFVSLCLVKQPTNRASVHQLLKHPFIRKAKKTSVIKEMFDEKAMQQRQLSRKDSLLSIGSHASDR